MGRSPMAALVFSHQTALKCWSDPRTRAPRIFLSSQEVLRLLESSHGSLDSPTFRKLIRENPGIPLSLPLDILVPTRNDRRRTNAAFLRFAGNQIPDGSVCPLLGLRLAGGNEVIEPFIVSPELCFLEMARFLDEIQLAELGYEFCGEYSVHFDDRGTLLKRVPITTASKLGEYAYRAKGMHGAKKARRVSGWIVDGSFSPRESQLALMLTLPRAKGGLGLPFPQMNASIKVPVEVSRILGYNTLRPDLYWPEANAAIEYDSTAWHSSAERLENDARRRNAYKMIGMNVFVITNGQYSDFRALQSIFQQVELLVIGTFSRLTDSEWASRQELHARFTRNH